MTDWPPCRFGSKVMIYLFIHHDIDDDGHLILIELLMTVANDDDDDENRVEMIIQCRCCWLQQAS